MKARHWHDLSHLLHYLSENYPFDQDAPYVAQIIGLDASTPEGDSPLHVVAGWGDAAATRMLVDAGARVDAVGDMGETPLHIAAKHASPEVIEVLVNAGARMDVVSDFGETPASLLEAKTR